MTPSAMPDLATVTRRIVDGVPTARSAVLVRDRCGRAELVDLVLAEMRSRGLEVIVERVSNPQLREIIGSRPVAELARWDVERAEVTARAEAVVTLGGWPADLGGLPEESVAVWAAAVGRVESMLELRRVPMVFAAVPTRAVADSLGVALDVLDQLVFDAIVVPADELAARTAVVVAAMNAADAFELLTIGGSARLRRAGRPLLVDDGIVDAADVAQGAIVSNLPAGSVYWTVAEDATRGTIALDDGSQLTFDDRGRVSGGPHEGERIGHIGIATNPRVTSTIGWTLVDEHRAGAVFVSLGENRYMGGENASEVNIDFVAADPTIRVGTTDVRV